MLSTSTKVAKRGAYMRDTAVYHIPQLSGTKLYQVPLQPPSADS